MTDKKTTATLRQSDVATAITVHRILPGTLAMLFGMFLVWGVGFAQPAEMHNAAHDSRHAFTFPCH